MNIGRNIINTMTNRRDSQLEPRVAKLETGLDILTQNVQNLTTAVRENSIAMEDKLERITIAVTQAQAPKKTDWSIIISGILLIMAIGSAVFWPLNQTSQNNKADIQSLTLKFEDHQKLNLHPVGAAIIDRIEKKLEDHITLNQRDMDMLDAKLQKEYLLVTADIKNKVDILDQKYDKEIQTLGDRVITRLNAQDQREFDKDRAELDELRQWRLKAMTGEIKVVTPPRCK